MATTAPAVKAALVRIITELHGPAGVQILYGVRATQAQQVVMAVTAITTDVERGPLGRTRRHRQETHQVTVITSVFRPGVDQQPVTELAYELIGALEEYLRTGPQGPTLGTGNANLDAYVSGMELDEQADDEDLQGKGRYASVTATVTVLAAST